MEIILNQILGLVQCGITTLCQIRDALVSPQASGVETTDVPGCWRSKATGNKVAIVQVKSEDEASTYYEIHGDGPLQTVTALDDFEICPSEPAPTTSLHPACFESGCSGYVSVGVQGDGTITVLQKFYEDFSDASTESVVPCCPCS